MTETIKVLVIGDIIGRPGRKTVAKRLLQLRKDWTIDVVVANVENAAGGFGLTPKVADELETMGIHIMTSGNHIYDKSEIIPFLDQRKNILRPANYPVEAPGHGLYFHEIRKGVELAVVNLQGKVLMPWIACPFDWIEKHLEQIRERTKVILVDFHGEATAEKWAMGWFLNGKVSAVYGTHTHVPTADARILPGEFTAFITDIGMTGPTHSIIGMDIRRSLQRLRTMFPRTLSVARGPCMFSAILLEIDPINGCSLSIRHIIEYDRNNT